MKFFEWMQKRINGKKKPSSILATHHYMVHEASKQEFSDWPQEILAIGTFGNKILKEDSASFKDCTHELSLEELVGINLENELNINLGEEEEEEIDGNFYTSNNLVYMSSRGRERCLDSSKSTGVLKKSLSYLVKKMFVCKSGLPSTPTLFKDPPSSTDSKMEKILSAKLHKKIHPQSSCSSSTMYLKKYLENNPIQDEDELKNEEEEESVGDVNQGIKWVNTDTEYIVLEI